jgi:hypothetical protein
VWRFGPFLFLYNVPTTKGISGRGGAFMELVILIIVVVLFLALLFGGGGLSLPVLLVNTVVGLILIFLTNLVLSPPIPINLITILISAIGGVVGWLIILVLHLLGVAFA